MRRSLTDFDRTEVGSRTRESIRDVRQRLSAIDRFRSGPEPEVERFRLVDFLNCRDILGVEPGDVHEHVVIDEHAVLILMRGTAVLLERAVLTRLERRLGGGGAASTQ